jgi:signal peptidase I
MYGVSAVITYEEAGSDFAGRTSLDEGGDIVEEEDYRYEEGIYVLQNDYFWENLDSNFEYYADSEMTAEEVRDHYGFVSDEDKAEIIKMYEEYLKENEITFESSNNG